jgi:hypothetical protein
MAIVLSLSFVGVRTGAQLAVNQTARTHHASASSTALPCRFGGPLCMDIGYTEAWLGGNTVDLEYSHDFFCRKPMGHASTRCEAGAPAEEGPPSGAVVSEIYAIVPMGFTPPKSTLQCPVAGHCIDFPRTIDLSRIGGDSNATLPAHSQIIEEDESFQSTWWPLVIVGVKSLSAWNQLVAAKSADAMDACEEAHMCTSEVPTNAFIFFQVLGPGMGTGGPD